MTVEILTPEALLFKGEVTGVTVPGAKAPFQLLDHHAAEDYRYYRRYYRV